MFVSPYLVNLSYKQSLDESLRKCGMVPRKIRYESSTEDANASSEDFYDDFYDEEVADKFKIERVSEQEEINRYFSHFDDSIARIKEDSIRKTVKKEVVLLDSEE
jgi:hypothetical protein